MNNKNILIFLVLMLVYINVFIPLSDKNNKRLQNIQSAKKAIAKDRLYIRQSKRIYNELNQSKSIIDIYEKHYFYNADSSEIFNIMQKEIKTHIKDASLHEDLINWGESYADGKIKLFPMQVRVSGSVKNIGKFLDKIITNHKINIKDFSMQRTKQHYILRLSIYGVKRG